MGPYKKRQKLFLRPGVKAENPRRNVKQKVLNFKDMQKLQETFFHFKTRQDIALQEVKTILDLQISTADKK